MENDLESLKKKFDLLTISRYRDRSKIEDAIEVQDRLREKSGDWNGVEEIRRWREKDDCIGYLRDCKVVFRRGVHRESFKD